MMRALLRSLIEYETPRYVKVHNPMLGLVLRLSQVGIITYILLFAILYKKGYQEQANVESSVITKVKGTTSSSLIYRTGINDSHRCQERVWDEADYVVPPAENGAFFITTNLQATPNQTQSVCPEDHTVKFSQCSTWNNTCQEGIILPKGHGKMTGKCLPKPGLSGVYDGVCEIAAWCPLEEDVEPSDPPILKDANHFTVYIKNSVAFPHFGEHYRKNNLEGERPSFFDPVSNPYGQIFSIGGIVEMAGGNFTQLAVRGGVISITIKWNCDLDWDFEKYCKPKFSFGVLEESGWNFRHAYHHDLNRRTLIKAYGLKFIIQVDGVGGMFSLKNTVLNIGNGLALLGITTVICEFILIHFIEEKQSVAKKKYDVVEPASPLMKNIVEENQV